MRTTAAFFLAIALALPAGAGDEGPAGGMPAPATRVGETYQQVLAERGHPSSEMAGGTIRMLYYPDGSVKLRNDVVVEVKAAASIQAGAAASPGASSPSPGEPPAGMVFGKDAVEKAIDGFKEIVLGRLEGGRFDELEVLSAHIIREKSLFGDGSWKILRFHEALELPAVAPEEKWRVREGDIVKWEARFPGSVTARTVHIGFLVSYARHARDPGSALSARDVAGSPLAERLARASDLFQTAGKLDEKSPMLWFEGQRVALLQGWPATDVLSGFYEAKRAEPGFWHYDGQVAEFLLPSWYGKDGDWEKLAEAEIQRSDGLGVEEYARTVYEMSARYKDVFKDSRAGWALVKEGYGAMVQKYPDSRKLLNQFALLAVLADDVPEAHEAFRAMGGQADPSVWSGRNISDFLARARWQP
jgi:hypothetical protein